MYIDSDLVTFRHIQYKTVTSSIGSSTSSGSNSYYIRQTATANSQVHRYNSYTVGRKMSISTLPIVAAANGIHHNHHNYQHPSISPHQQQNQQEPPPVPPKMPTTAILPASYPRCSCCPFGYHIDLDFINYCKTLAKTSPSVGQKLRRDRRRQRHSMEIMLGGGLGPSIKQTDTLEMLPKVGEVHNEVAAAGDYCKATDTVSERNHTEKRLASAFANNALADVVQDFEKTLERSRTKSLSRERDDGPDTVVTPPPIGYDRDNNRMRRERFFMDYESHFKAESRHENGQSQSPGKDIDVESVKSCSSNASEMSTGALQYIREQMASSLNKIRDLEEQNKMIPILQKQLAALRDDKIMLEKQLTFQKARGSSPFSTQRVSPVNLRSNSFSEIIRPKSTMRDIGVNCLIPIRDNETNTIAVQQSNSSVGTKLSVPNGDEKLYTELEVQRLLEQERETMLGEVKSRRPGIREMGTQTVAEPKPLPPAVVHQSIQTDGKRTSSTGISCKPEVRHVGSSDHTIKDIFCEKCRVRKRTTASGPDDFDAPPPVSLKLLDRKSQSHSNASLADTMTSSQTSIGTQIGNTTRDAGTQSMIVSFSNKSSQSDAMIVKSKLLDTHDLIDLRHQYSNTDAVPKEEPKATKTTSTNTVKTVQHSTATNTEVRTVQETAANTEMVSRSDVAVGSVDRSHFTITCDINHCDSCKEAIRKLAKDVSSPTTAVPKSPLIGDGSRIPRPSASPLAQRRTLKRQDTYTVDEQKNGIEKNIEDDKKLSALKCPLDNIIGARVHNIISSKINDDSAEEQKTIANIKEEPSDEKEAAAVAPQTITVESTPRPGYERPISVVAEEEAEDEMEVTASSSTSSQRILESDLKKEFPNLPRRTARPTREMMAALKVINDSLMKSMDGHSLLNANTIVRKEWFKISSTESADPLDLEDYLDCFEEFSCHLLRYMVNLSDANGNTAMHYAVSHGNFDVVSILLDSKVCNVNQINNAGYTCVMLVSLVKLIEASHRHVVQRLFHMSDVNIKAKKHNQTALMLAVSHGNLDMVSILLEAGADINIQDEDGSTALMCAAEHGKIDIVKLLLAQPDCDSGIQDVDGSTALKIALDAGYRDIGILLYAHDHMSRHKTSPHSTLPRKSKLSMSRYSPAASAPASPAPSKKHFDHHRKGQ